MSEDMSSPIGPTPDDGERGQSPPSDPGGPSGPAAGRFDLRQLRRSRDDRMIGGVCGGLGRYVGIDPIIFRIVLAALAIFGGVGLVLYALGWLLIPEDGTDVSELQRLFRGRPSPAPIIAAIVAGVLGIIIVTQLASHHRGGFVVLLVLAVVAVVAITSRARQVRPTTASPQYSPPQYGPEQYSPPQYSPAQYSAPLGPPAGFSPSRPVYTQAPAYPPPPNYVPPPTVPLRKAPKPPSFLAPIAISVGVVMVGVLFALDASHAIELSAQAIFATSLLVVGLALVVGTWIGRARVLIAVGVVLTIALAVAAALDVPLSGGIGGRYYTPTSAADIPKTYQLGIGHQTIDLFGLNLAGKKIQVTSRVGVGEVEVRVPADVRVVARGRAGTGDVSIAGDDSGGSHIDRTLVLPARGQVVAGEIDLDLRVGLGRVLVVQEATP